MGIATSLPASARPRRRRRLGVVLVAAGVVALAAASMVRVPDGHLGFVRGRMYHPGVHLAAPYPRPRIVAADGALEGVDLFRQSAEGSRVQVRLSLGYRLDAKTVAARADAIASGGVAGLVSGIAAATLETLPPAALFLPGAGRGERAPLPPGTLETLARALRSAGVETSSFTGRVGPAGAFPPAGAVVTMPHPDGTGVRLLLVGLDGADWDTIDPLLRQGRLPNLARLIGGGTRALMRSYDPMISPLLWTTMVTGVGPDRHGIADFQAVDEATGRRVPISSRFRKTKALWNILGDAGLSSGFVAWWASYPAEQVHGYQVSNLVVYETLRPRPAGAPPPAGIAWPPDYFDAIRPSLVSAADLSFDDLRAVLHVDRDTFEAARADVLKKRAPESEAPKDKLAQQPVPLAVSILTTTRNHATLAADLARRGLDLTAVYFEGIDMMGHRFQHCMPPRIALCPDDDFARYRDAVTSFYVVQDAALGRILQAAGDRVTTMVVSDHGFKTGEDRPRDVLPFTSEQPVEWHHEDGIFILSGGPAQRGVRLAPRVTLFDVAPTVLHLLGLPISDDMPGRVVVEALDDAFVAAHPVRSIASYEKVGARPVVTAAGPGAEEAEAELLANLRALGYIGGDAAPEPAASRPSAGGPASAAVGPDKSPQAAAPQGAPSTPASLATRNETPGATTSNGASGTREETQVFYHRNLATYFMKRKDYAQAAEQLVLANRKQKLPKNYQLLSEAYLGMGRAADAVAALEEGLRETDTMDPEAILWMVRIRLEGGGGRDAALGDLRRHHARVARAPGLADAIAGFLEEDAGRPEAAEPLYLRSLQADPARVPVAQRLYAYEAARGRASTLEPLLRRALARDRRIDEYHNLLGTIQAESGRTSDAVASFRRAVDLDPENARFVSNLAGALARLARWEEAAAAYEQAASLLPAPGVYMKLGSVYRRLRQPRNALQAFSQARALGESGSGPILGMALARAEMNDVAEALALVRGGLDRFPQDTALRSLYADLSARRAGGG